jgi:diguanylate cyclase (GGDEF)-like protein
LATSSTWGRKDQTVTHWTQVLSNVALVEFVLLGALTALAWVRHRIPGAGWIASTFVIIAALALALKIDPGLASNEHVAKSLLALLVVTPYCLFRFAAALLRPRRVVRVAAALATLGTIAFTYALEDLPAAGRAAPPDFLAYRTTFAVALVALLAWVVIRLVMAGRGEPPIAALRMRLLAVAVAGFAVLVVVFALGLRGPTIDLATRALAVGMGVLFLLALAVPSGARVLVGRKEDAAFRVAVEELVTAGDARQVGERLLPPVCALVGGSSAALLRSDGTVVAHVPAWISEGDVEGSDDVEGRDGPDGAGAITVRTHSGSSHELAVTVSRPILYFGREELRQLDQLSGMVGLAIERCERAEAMAYQAAHDGLTGLANRNLFMERLGEALHHVGRRRQALAVLFVDLDRFKSVNDRADHTLGDVVLCEMARRLTAMTRGVDVVARFGGDEFVVLAEVDHDDDALDMAERIRQGLAQPIAIGDGRLVVTASVGLALTADGTASPASVVRDADDAMYDAKRLGRDRVVLAGACATADRAWGLGTTRALRLNAG